MNAPGGSRPTLVALAGPNGAGKSTFYHAHLRLSGLRFVNADDLARELRVGAYEAADIASEIRKTLIAQRESFIFETVFSDPVGDKVQFLENAASIGYDVVVYFIGLESVELSDERVAMRALQGGHDVPVEKLRSRYGRSLRNLFAAIARLPKVVVFDNSDRKTPFRRVAEYADGELVYSISRLPTWLKP